MDWIYRFDRAVRRAAPHATMAAIGALFGFFLCYFAALRPAVATERDATESAVRALDEKTVEAGKHETRAQRLTHDIEQERAWKNQAALERDTVRQDSFQIQRFNSGAWVRRLDGRSDDGVIEVFRVPPPTSVGDGTAGRLAHGTRVQICAIQVLDGFAWFEVEAIEGPNKNAKGWVSHRLIDFRT